jgi:hypothetical protein
MVALSLNLRDSFGIAVRGIAVEPSGSSKWTVAGEIWKGRQITTLNVRSLLHPRRIVLKVLTNLRPSAFEMPCLNLP